MAIAEEGHKESGIRGEPMNDRSCPEGYAYVSSHKRLGRYVQPHCRKAPERYDEDVTDLGMRAYLEG